MLKTKNLQYVIKSNIIGSLVGIWVFHLTIVFSLLPASSNLLEVANVLFMNPLVTLVGLGEQYKLLVIASSIGTIITIFFTTRNFPLLEKLLQIIVSTLLLVPILILLTIGYLFIITIIYLVTAVLPYALDLALKGEL